MSKSQRSDKRSRKLQRRTPKFAHEMQLIGSNAESNQRRRAKSSPIPTNRSGADLAKVKEREGGRTETNHLVCQPLRF